jgi:hypothetical protein
VCIRVRYTAAMRVSLLAPALLALPLAAGCAAPSDENDTDATESELRERVPQGTYTSSSGPSGTLDSMLAYQKHVTRLTVLTQNKYEAEVLKEVAATKPNPFFPWLSYRAVETTKQVARGTMKFGTDANGAPTVELGSDVGSFGWKLDNGRLELRTTGAGAGRTTVLRLDPTYRPPAPPAPVKLECVHRYVDDGDKITVTLDEDDNQAGRISVRRASARSSWPAAGAYTMALSNDASTATWREYRSTSATRNSVTLRFPVRELEAGRGSFDAGGSYWVGDAFMGGAFNLSLRCTHP